MLSLQDRDNQLLLDEFTVVLDGMSPDSFANGIYRFANTSSRAILGGTKQLIITDSSNNRVNYDDTVAITSY